MTGIAPGLTKREKSVLVNPVSISVILAFLNGLRLSDMFRRATAASSGEGKDVRFLPRIADISPRTTLVLLVAKKLT